MLKVMPKIRERLLNEIDEYLSKIREEKEELSKLEEAFNRELEALQNKYYPHIERHKALLKSYEADLEKLAKSFAHELFVDSDLIELRNGRLIREEKEAVKRARGVLERLEKLGWNEAIIATKKVNWSVLETWPEEKLIACGTERVKKTKIVYELKEAKGE